MAGEELCSATKITLRLSPGSTFPFLKPRLTFFLLYSKVWAPFRYLRYIAPWWTYSTPLDDTSIFYLGLLASKETQLLKEKEALLLRELKCIFLQFQCLPNNSSFRLLKWRAAFLLSAMIKENSRRNEKVSSKAKGITAVEVAICKSRM